MKVKIRSKSGFKIIDLNRRKATNERCLNCSGWSPSEAANCLHKDCQLYPFRLGVGKQNAQKRSKAIRQYCLWCCANQSFEVRKCVAYACPLWAYRKSTTDKSREIRNLVEKPYIDPVSQGISLGDISGDGIEPGIPKTAAI